MSGQYQSITDGIILVGTIIFWSFFIDWLSFKVKFIQRLTEPPPLLLVENSKMLRHNMRRELVTESELLSQLREQGIENISLVKKSYMEADGHLSVIIRDGQPGGKQARD